MKAFHSLKVPFPLWIRNTPRFVVFSATLTLLYTCSATLGWAQTAYSRASGAEVNVQLDIGSSDSQQGVFLPAPVVSGQGPSDYGPVEDSAAGVAIDLSELVIVESGSLHASINYVQSLGQLSGMGQADNIFVSTALVDSFGDSNFIVADSVSSEALILGSCGSLVGNPTSSIVNGSINIDGVVINLPQNPSPNTTLDLEPLGWVGTVVTLNEQTISQNSLGEMQVTVNAMHVRFNATQQGISLNGNVIFGSSTARVTDCVEPGVADLVLSHTASADSVLAGQLLEYSIEVNNAGPDAAINLLITDALEDTLSIVSIAPEAGLDCVQFVQQVICLAELLEVGDTVNVVISVIPETPGTISNSAEVYGEGSDPDNSNNLAVVSTEILPDEADLSLGLSVSETSVSVGAALNYTIQVDNTGPAEAIGYAIESVLSDEVSIVSVSADAGVNCSQSGQQVTCNGAVLPAGDTVTVMINARADRIGTATTTASAASATSDPDGSDNQASVSSSITFGIGRRGAAPGPN